MILARIFGHILNKLNQPAVIGEIIAGFILGGSGLGLLSNHHIDMGVIGYQLTLNLPEINYASGDFRLFADLGILFLLFISGLETDMFKLKKMGKAASLTAICGVIVPLILGIYAGIYFGFSWQISIVIGLTLVATSVGITVRTLMNLKRLDTKYGITILGAAVIDDVVGIILLVFILGGSPLGIAIKIAIYFLIFFYLGLKIINKVLVIGDRIRLPQALVSISLAILFIYAFFADKAGITGIIGGFVAGLLIGNTAIGTRKIKQDIRIIGEALFIPLFFIWVGASVDLTAFLSIGYFAVVIILISIVGKIFGCSLGSRIAGLNNRDSLLVGVGMIPRLEMAIVTVTIAISHGIIANKQVSDKLLAATILVCIISAIITPPMIKLLSTKYNN